MITNSNVLVYAMRAMRIVIVSTSFTLERLGVYTIEILLPGQADGSIDLSQ